MFILMKVLITGVGGMIGGSLANRLIKEGHDVIGLDRFSKGDMPGSSASMRYVKVDVRLPEIATYFDGIDVVFHLAARNSIRESEKDPVGTLEANVLTTAQVFTCAQNAGVKKVIYASSAVLDRPGKPQNIYAVSKASCELLAQAFEKKGLSTVGLRYYNVYGPGDRSSIISKFISSLRKGGPPVLFEGDENNCRDFIHIDDVTEFNLFCLSNPNVDHKVLSVGTGKSHSMKDVLGLLQKTLGTSLEPTILSREKGDMPVVMKADISALVALGWSPKISLEEGIQNLDRYE